MLYHIYDTIFDSANDLDMHHHTVFTLLASLACVHAWLSTSNIRIGRAQLHSTPDPANPCWQDNYDSEDDCLSITYSAAFVAEEWIKSMPCGKVRPSNLCIRVLSCCTALLHTSLSFVFHRMRIACQRIYHIQVSWVMPAWRRSMSWST